MTAIEEILTSDSFHNDIRWVACNVQSDLECRVGSLEYNTKVCDAILRSLIDRELGEEAAEEWFDRVRNT